MPTQQVVTRSADAAIFLTLTVAESDAAVETVRDVLGEVSGHTRAVNFRRQDADLVTVVGIGSRFFDRLTSAPRPAHLHPFPTDLVGEKHSAPSTAGDILLHVRGRDMGMCWEVIRIITGELGDAVTVVDEVHGFRYFDNRDLLGFVDGTENPEGTEAYEVVQIGPEDPEHQGGTYVHVQNYTHDMAAWEALSVEEQERVIGRTKLDDIELDDDVKPSNSHVALNDIQDEDGNDLDIYRLNMPFAQAEGAIQGTYFIGYSASPDTTEEMLRHMFIGDPPGNYDRILDFSTAVTGAMFYVPTVDYLDAIPDLPPANSAPVKEGQEGEASSDDETPTAAQAAAAAGVDGIAVVSNHQAHAESGDGSLGIGSLKHL